MKHNNISVIKESNNRWVYSIDPLRGLSALSVVFCHVLQSNGGTSSSLLKLAEFFGAFGVGIFFIISGFCIHYANIEKKNINLKLFFYRRFYRLYPTYLAALVFSSIVGYFYGGHLLTAPKIDTFLSHLFLINNFINSEHFNSINTVFWTISMEIYFYLAYPVLFYFRKKYDWYLILPVLLFISLCIYFLASTFLENDPRFIVQHIFLNYWWQWALGAWIAEMYRNGLLNFSIYLRYFSLIVLLFCFLIYYSDLIILKLHLKIYTTPFLLAIFLSLIINIKNRNLVSTSFKILGKFSYSLYLTHTAILGICSYFFDLNLFQLIFFGIPICLIFSYVFFLLFEKKYLKSDRSLVLTGKS
jgi:peptidoglycan/LPS O-acetylase OafA/YrhL